MTSDRDPQEPTREERLANADAAASIADAMEAAGAATFGEFMQMMAERER